MKRLVILLILSVFIVLATTGCWSVRYDNVSDQDYYMYPGFLNLDYVNSLAPTEEITVAPLNAVVPVK